VTDHEKIELYEAVVTKLWAVAKEQVEEQMSDEPIDEYTPEQIAFVLLADLEDKLGAINE